MFIYKYIHKPFCYCPALVFLPHLMIVITVIKAHTLEKRHIRSDLSLLICVAWPHIRYVMNQDDGSGVI